MAEGSPAALIREHSSARGARGAVRVDATRTAAATLAGIGDRLEVLPDRILVYGDDGEAALVEVTRRGLQPVTSLVRRSASRTCSCDSPDGSWSNDRVTRAQSRGGIAAGAKPRRYGAWYVAEHTTCGSMRSVRRHASSRRRSARPFLYLFAFGVGLATLVSANVGPVSTASATSSSSRPRCSQRGRLVSRPRSTRSASCSASSGTRPSSA